MNFAGKSQIAKPLAALRRILPVPSAFLAAALVFSFLHHVILLVVLALALAMVGVPHGSCDDHVAGHGRRRLPFYFFYFFKMLAFVAVWLLSPLAALVLFLVISAFHFGEGEIRGSGIGARCQQFIWGSFAILFGASQHFAGVSATLGLLGDFPAQMLEFNPNSVARLGLLLWSLACLVSLGHRGRSPSFLRTFCLGVVLGLAPLAAGFVAFFCFWHSIDSMGDQQRALRWTRLGYYRNGLAHSMAALALLAAAAIWFIEIDDLPDLWRALFVMTGALTVAHGHVMHQFYRDRTAS